jgi:hypothetical protein
MAVRQARVIFTEDTETIGPNLTKSRLALALVGISCALAASPLSADARGLRAAIFDFELIDASLEGARATRLTQF